ncbi:MAG: hypothetical protein K5643_01480 [Saccharofermentans sp.]|nr:hypothetical protein [Saccharofermentans sp.]
MKKSSASLEKNNINTDKPKVRESKGRGTTGLLVVTGIIAFAVVGAAVAALILFPGNQEKPAEDTTVPSQSVSDTEPTDLSAIIAETSGSRGTRNTDPAVLKGIDANAPYILDNKNITLDIAKGQKMDPTALDGALSYIDDYDPEPKVTYTGEVNDAVAGTYPITVTITDWAGNSSKCSIKVKVWDSTGYTPPTTESTKEPEPKYFKFKDFVEKYGSRGTAVGIDVSKWQGNIDFDKVKAAGCDFVIMRCGVYYEKEFKLDPTFEANYRNAKAAGLKVGIYYASTDATVDEVRINANKLVDALNGDKLDFPITFDWENFGHIQRYKISLNDLCNLYDVFEQACNERGYETMLYASKYYLTEIWKPADSVTVWLAQYSKKITYKGTFYMWQVSDCGKIDGIDGPVDMDILMPEGGGHGPQD